MTLFSKSVVFKKKFWATEISLMFKARISVVWSNLHTDIEYQYMRQMLS